MYVCVCGQDTDPGGTPEQPPGGAPGSLILYLCRKGGKLEKVVTKTNKASPGDPSFPRMRNCQSPEPHMYPTSIIRIKRGVELHMVWQPPLALGSQQVAPLPSLPAPTPPTGAPPVPP